MKSIFFILAFVLCISFTFAQKKSEAKISKEQATKTVLASIKDGKIESSELEKEDGKLIWSFDVKVAKKIQEVWVDANSGVIIKTETESPKDEINEKAMDKAEKIALQKVKGEVVKSESETKKGIEVYCFEIKTKEGKIKEVTIDKKTNKVINVEEEKKKDDDDDEEKDDDDND